MPATSSRPGFPDVNIILLILLSGFSRAAIGAIFGLPSLRIKGFYLAVATLAAQFFLSWCFVRAALARQLQRLQRHRGADPQHVRHRGHRSERDADGALSGRAVDRGLHDLDRRQYRARPHRAHLDGGARHGHRRRTDRHPALPHQAARLCDLVVLLRRRRRDDGVSVARRGGSDILQHQPVLHHPVHGDHRRARQPDRLVLRRRVDLGPADHHPRHAGGFRTVAFAPPPSSISSS